jgi:hypothetical protein
MFWSITSRAACTCNSTALPSNRAFDMRLHRLPARGRLTRGSEQAQRRPKVRCALCTTPRSSKNSSGKVSVARTTDRVGRTGVRLWGLVVDTGGCSATGDRSPRTGISCVMGARPALDRRERLAYRRPRRGGFGECRMQVATGRWERPMPCKATRLVRHVLGVSHGYRSRSRWQPHVTASDTSAYSQTQCERREVSPRWRSLVAENIAA